MGLTMLRILVVIACITALTTGDGVGSRIVGGNNAGFGQFPYQVSIRQYGQHICGGSIIDRTKILTAAHCFNNVQGLSVAVGSNRLDVIFQEFPVISGIRHPYFDHQSNLNDVAVLTIGTPLFFSYNINKIELAISNPETSSNLTLSGWGMTSYPGVVSSILKYVSLISIDVNMCVRDLKDYPVGLGHVCTVSPENRGTCQGDSGGPLVDQSGKQVGIVSWVIPCATGRPDVFTSVAYYRSWILSH